MTRWRLYPAKPSGKLVKTFSLDVLRNLDDTPAKVALSTNEHGLYQWGVLIPFASAYNTRAWLYVPDYASHDAPPAFVYVTSGGVLVLRIAVSEKND